MDFVTRFPQTSKGFNSIWVIVDQLTKFAHFLLVKTTYIVYAYMYIDDIVRLHGVLVSIISNRGPQFTSEALGTCLDLSTAFHFQTDRQSEKTIQILEDMLKAYVLDFGGSWSHFLPLIQFSYNNNHQSGIQMEPFESLYGRHCQSLIS